MKLVTSTKASNDSAIEVLRNMLERAEKGEVLSVGISAVLTEGRITWRVGGGRDTATLLGVTMLVCDQLKCWLKDEG